MAAERCFETSGASKTNRPVSLEIEVTSQPGGLRGRQTYRRAPHDGGEEDWWAGRGGYGRVGWAAMVEL